MANKRVGPAEGSPAEGAVLTTILTQGPIARVDIAQRTGLSFPAVTRAVKALLDSGYLEHAAIPVEVNSGDGPRMGRPTIPLQVRAQRAGAVGIKITSDEIIGVATNLYGDPLTSLHQPLESPDVDGVVQAIATMWGALTESAPASFRKGSTALGLSLSGDIDHASGHVRYSPFLGWRDVPLGSLVAQACESDVVVENDVKALAVAERWFGLGRGVTSFALVTIGAGIGCSLVLDGELVRGSHSVAGEIGHLPLGSSRVKCHCGGRGCVEAVASATAILEQCRVAAGKPGLSLDQAVKLARESDGDVRQVFARAGHIIGLALASVANLVGPERIIVAGEGVSAYDLMEQSARKAFTQQAFGAAADCSIHVRDLSFEEWARGAAAVSIQELVFPATRNTAVEISPAVSRAVHTRV